MSRARRGIGLLVAVLLGLSFLAPAVRAAQEQAGDRVEAKEKEKAKPSVVAVFRLSGPLLESPMDESIPLFAPPGVSLKDLVTRMRKAADDPSVKAVVLVAESAGVGNAQVEEIRQAMDRVRSAGKEVYVHADSVGMGEYVLFSGASRLSVVPTADLWVKGLYAEQPYVRGLLDKLGVVPQFLTCGDYKSAAEMFTRKGPSPEADRMTNWLLDGLYDTYVGLIARGRKRDAKDVRALIDNGPYTAETAKEAGLIDAIEHRQEFMAMLREKHGRELVLEKKYGQPRPPKMDLSSPFGMLQLWAELLGGAQKSSAQSTRPGVGIVYVEGPIMVGSSAANPSPFSFGGGVALSSDVRKALDQAAADDAIKAVVLRVNSPGGSAVASEIILDATRRVKAKKPFVVSMGDVAGSGGYYVACAADTIFADENTITASIGVVAGKLITTAMWDKVGVDFKGYARGKNAAMLSSSAPFSDSERKRMQEWMDSVYKTFRGHVTAARGDRLKKPLDEIAGGRVYTGKQALELGLVDKIGTLSDAVAFVAEQAKLEKGYDVRVVPKPKNILELLMASAAGDDEEGRRSIRLGASAPSLVDLAMPHLQHLDPARVAAVRSALVRLQLLQEEGVLLTMPEIVIGN